MLKAKKVATVKWKVPLNDDGYISSDTSTDSEESQSLNIKGFKVTYNASGGTVLNDYLTSFNSVILTNVFGLSTAVIEDSGTIQLDYSA